MNLEIFSVYDSKAETYMAPWTATNKATAIRAFSDQCNNPDSSFSRHPHDYALMHLGSWDDQTARYETLEVPTNMGLAHEFKTQQEMFE